MNAFTASRFACPRCRANGRLAPLFTHVAGGVGMNGCGACGGVFLAPECVRRLAEALPEEAIALSDRAARAARYQPDTAAPLRCPSCDEAMARVRAGRAGVDLDRCDAHGTFYDREEIGRVAAAIRAAGRAGAGREAATVTVRAKPAAKKPQARAGVDSDVVETAVDIAGAVAFEVGAEVVLEGVFAVIGGLFDLAATCASQPGRRARSVRCAG